jgi:hypothetical protein
MAENLATSQASGPITDPLLAAYASASISRQDEISSRSARLYASTTSHTSTAYATATAFPTAQAAVGSLPNSLPWSFYDHYLPCILYRVIYPFAGVFVLFQVLGYLAKFYPEAGRDGVRWCQNACHKIGQALLRVIRVIEFILFDVLHVTNRLRYNSFWPRLQQWRNRVYNWILACYRPVGIACVLVVFFNVATSTSRESRRIYNEYHDPGGVAFAKREMEKVSSSLAAQAEWDASSASSATALPEPTWTETQSSTRTWDWVSDIVYNSATPVIATSVSAETDTDSWFRRKIWKKAAPVASDETGQFSSITREITWPTERTAITMPFIDWAAPVTSEEAEARAHAWEYESEAQEFDTKRDVEGSAMVGNEDEEAIKMEETKRAEEGLKTNVQKQAEEMIVKPEAADALKQEIEREQSRKQEEEVHKQERKQAELKEQEDDIRSAMEESRNYLEEKRLKEEEEDRSWTGFASWPSTVDEPVIPSDAFRASVKPSLSRLNHITTELPLTDSSDIPSAPCTTVSPASISYPWLSRNFWGLGPRKLSDTPTSRELGEASEFSPPAIITPWWPSAAQQITVSLTPKHSTKHKDFTPASDTTVITASPPDTWFDRSVRDEKEEDRSEAESDTQLRSATPHNSTGSTSALSSLPSIMDELLLPSPSLRISTPISDRPYATESTLPTYSTSNPWFGHNIWRRVAEKWASTPDTFKVRKSSVGRAIRRTSTMTVSLFETTTLHGTTTATITTTIKPSEEATAVKQSVSTSTQESRRANVHTSTTTVSLFETMTLHNTATATVTTTIKPSEEATAAQESGSTSTSSESITRSHSSPSTTTTTLFEIETVHTTRTSTLTTTIDIGDEGCGTEPKIPPSKMPSTGGDAGEAKPLRMTTTSTLLETTTIYPTKTRTITTTIEARREATGVISAVHSLVDTFVPVGTGWPKQPKVMEKGDDVHFNGRELKEGETAFCRQCRQKHCCRVVA